MSRLPRPRGASSAGIRRVGSRPSPSHQLLQNMTPGGFRVVPFAEGGLDDWDARRGDGTEVGRDMSHGIKQYNLGVLFI
ncbi:unnamed protein product [Urochloa humidicola]